MNVRLHPDTVHAIRVHAGILRVATIARVLGLPPSTVRHVVEGRTWRRADANGQPLAGRQGWQLEIEPMPEEITAAESPEDLSLDAWPHAAVG